MTCHYCSSIGVVGGTMPWPNGTSHANPCAYCKSSPALKFKAGATPWTGVVMPVPNFTDGKVSAMSLYAEPDVAGDRVIVVVDPRCRMWCWGETGKYAMSNMLIGELTVLATEIMFDGYPEYSCGVAFEGIVVGSQGQDGLITGGDLALYVAVPLLSLLDGVDTHNLGTRRLDLELACKRAGEALSYELIPRIMLKARTQLTQAHIDDACKQLNVDSIMVKQVQGRWGVTPCWVRASKTEDF